MDAASRPGGLRVVVFLSGVLGAVAACSGGGGKATPDGGMNDADIGADIGPSVGVSTATGIATGQPTTQPIGPEGGTVVSADGKLTVTIPAGALATESPISITGVGNFAPGGIGSAYRLEPAGVTFAAPVELALTFTADDIAGGSADVLAWAFQDEAGIWHKSDSTVDAGASVLRTSTTHFSDWSPVLGLALRPGRSNLKVGMTLAVQVISCDSVQMDGQGRTLLGQCQPVAGSAVSGWSVNSVAGGNATFGTIAGAGRAATYTAPAARPSANPVRISVEAPFGAGRTILFSYVQITDGRIKWSFATTFTPEVSDDPTDVSFKAEAMGEFHGDAIAGNGLTTGSVMITRVPPRPPRQGECSVTVAPAAQMVVIDDVNTTTAVVLADGSPFYGATVVTFFKYEETLNCPNQPPETTMQDDAATWLVIPMMPRNPDDLVLEGRFMGDGDTWTWTLRKSEE
jgi:hypothetical protein